MTLTKIHFIYRVVRFGMVFFASVRPLKKIDSDLFAKKGRWKCSWKAYAAVGIYFNGRVDGVGEFVDLLSSPIYTSVKI